MKVSVDQYCINVSDLARSVDFYENARWVLEIASPDAQDRPFETIGPYRPGAVAEPLDGSDLEARKLKAKAVGVGMLDLETPPTGKSRFPDGGQVTIRDRRRGARPGPSPPASSPRTVGRLPRFHRKRESRPRVVISPSAIQGTPESRNGKAQRQTTLGIRVMRCPGL